MSGYLNFDQYSRRQWWGFTDLGPIQIPPQPFYTILTDRSTGAYWYLTFQTGQLVPNYLDQLGTIAIITPSLSNTLRDVGYGHVPTYALFPGIGSSYAAYAQLYLPENEPWLEGMPQGYAARLFVRNSVLGAEIFAENDPLYTSFGDQSQIVSAPIFALPQTANVGFGSAFRRLFWSTNTTVLAPIGFVAWENWVITQTPNPPRVNSAANLSNPKADV